MRNTIDLIKVFSHDNDDDDDDDNDDNFFVVTIMIMMNEGYGVRETTIDDQNAPAPTLCFP